jgi:hypothetical protein
MIERFLLLLNFALLVTSSLMHLLHVAGGSGADEKEGIGCAVLPLDVLRLMLGQDSLCYLLRQYQCISSHHEAVEYYHYGCH